MPTVEQRFAAWKRSHPGYTCGLLDRSSGHGASATCTTVSGTQIRVALVTISLPDNAETQPAIGGSVDWGQILW